MAIGGQSGQALFKQVARPSSRCSALSRQPLLILTAASLPATAHAAAHTAAQQRSSPLASVLLSGLSATYFRTTRMPSPVPVQKPLLGAERNVSRRVDDQLASGRKAGGRQGRRGDTPGHAAWCIASHALHCRHRSPAPSPLAYLTSSCVCAHTAHPTVPWPTPPLPAAHLPNVMPRPSSRFSA